MEFGTLATIGAIVGSVLVFALIIGLIATRALKRASASMAFVRTGSGGIKVVKDGSAFIIPVLHKFTDINMETMTVPVSRSKDEALITSDKLRVDVKAEFFLRVSPDDTGISTAAQTLGNKTLNPNELRELVEGKFVDSLRAVAAKMEMNQLHENRIDFVQSVQETLAEDLAKNGLELESVSLTGLDQTEMAHFNPNNAFDAEGLKKLTQITEQRRKERNEIEKDAEISIAQRNLEAKQRTLEIAQQEATTVAEREREIAQIQASEGKTAELARISAERETEEARITKDRQIAEAEITKNRALEEQRIGKEKAVETAELEKAQTVEAANIERQKTVELAEQDRAIAVAEKSRQQSEAKANAERARAEAVTETQTVLTAEATAIAEREKDIAVIAEKAEAEKKAAGILVAAHAERTAAEDRAAAVTTAAKAEANRITTMAEAKAKDYEVEAAGKAAINAALNQIPQAEREMIIKQALINQMPSMIEQMAKPIGDIDSIRVLDMRGSGSGDVQSIINGEAVAGSTTGSTSSDNLPQQVVDGLMKYKVSMPLLNQLADEIGIDLSEGLGGLTKGLSIADEATDTPTVEPTKTRSKTKGGKSAA